MRVLIEQRLTICVFLISSLLIVVGVYVGIPYFMDKFDITFGEAYLFCFYTPFILLFFCHIILYKMEGNSFNWKGYSTRLRLKRMDKRTVKILAISFVVIMIGFGITSILSRLISDNISFMSVPDSFPAGLNHNKPMVDGYFFDVPLAGNWMLPLLYFVGWFFNIFGEELMFRGMLLPKNEESFNNRAWLFQGILWGFWHIFWFWQIIPLTIFVAIPFVYVVQKTKNSWVGIIIHGTMNLIPLIVIITGVISSS